MNQINHNEEENNPVKKALNTLPKVNVSEDFEQRLQRRLVQEEPKPAFFGKFVRSRFVPAMTYSLMALIAVGIVSYYVFMRTGVDSFSRPPVNESNQPAESGNTNPVQQQQDQLMHDEPSANKQENVTVEQGGEPVERQPESFTKQIEKRDADQKETEIDQTRQVQSVQSEGAENAGKVNQSQEVKVQQAPALQPSAKGALPAVTVPSFQSQGVMSTQQILLADSLRKDSLQKVQQQFLQQKAKLKKP